ncbi:diguanylate cyclase [uncultured Maritalea sp.]|uniref:sensor domain-containing diguanylate cyclase n=1 Tax=uncultured Maritalea sp. TaxID=757249 RepID=UPI00261C312C|nr:diguanylate cyclase [uncultured Maritalea sp.]
MSAIDIDRLVGQIAEFASDGIFVAELVNDGSSFPTILWCNSSACAQSGYKSSELRGKPLYRIIGGQKDAKVFVEIADRMQQPTPIQKRFENVAKDGTGYQVCLSLRPVEDKKFPNRYWIGLQRDDTENDSMRNDLKTARQELKLYKRRLWDAIEALPDAFVMYDINDRLVVCNNKYKEFYAASAPAIYPGASFVDIMRYGVENGQYPEAKGREEEWLQDWFQWHLDRRRSSTKPLERELPGDRHILIHDIETENGDIVGLRTDVTELQQKKKELEKLTISLEKARKEAEIASLTDPLTRVGNRRGLTRFLEQVAKPGKTDFEVAFIHFDLDHFKEVNDEYGHAAGDLVLCKVADALRKSTRSEDFIARVGGDEFVVVLLSKNAQRAAEKIAKRLLDDCKREVRFDDNLLSYGISIGIAVSTSGELDDLQERADKALYDAKAQGRGTYVCYAA